MNRLIVSDEKVEMLWEGLRKAGLEMGVKVNWPLALLLTLRYLCFSVVV